MKRVVFLYMIVCLVGSSFHTYAQEGEATTEEFYLELPKQSSQFIADLPPILTIDSISFSEDVLDAKEAATLSITVRNVGPGEARDIFVNLVCNSTNISFPQKSYFLPIAANGGQQKIDIEIIGELNLSSSECVMHLEVVDPIFKVNIKGKQLKFSTRESPKPKLILAKYGIYENQSSRPNGKIDINETIDLNFAVQNIGLGNAELVTVEIDKVQEGVLAIGQVENESIIRKNPEYDSIAPGKYKNIAFRYYVNSEFTEENIEFTIRASDKTGNYGFTETITFPINKTIKTSGYIRTIAAVTTINKSLIIEDIPDFVSDVDINIPKSDSLNQNAFALIIGNENYSREQSVPYAINDAKVFSKYVQNALGVPVKHVRYLEDATLGELEDGIEWINDVIGAYKGKARVYVYYAGHGIPDVADKKAYILPVDGSSSSKRARVALSDLYAKLEEHPSDGVFVFLDACFSGGSRQGMLADGRGVSIKPKDNLLEKNIVVYSATSNDETAHPFEEQSHGLFTYFLLKKLQETKGVVSLKELSDYIDTNVTQKSVVENKPQHPKTNVGVEIKDTWEGIILK